MRIRTVGGLPLKKAIGVMFGTGMVLLAVTILSDVLGLFSTLLLLIGAIGTLIAVKYRHINVRASDAGFAVAAICLTLFCLIMLGKFFIN